MKILFTLLLLLPSFLYAQDSTLEPLAIEERYKFTDSVDQDVLEGALLRASPDALAKVLATIPKGKIVTLLGRDNGYYRATYNDQIGFIHFLFIDGDYKKFKARTFAHGKYQAVNYENETNNFVLYGKVNVDSPLKVSPSFSAKTIYAVPEGSVIKISQYNASYWKAEANGITGYLGKTFVVATGKTISDIERSVKPVAETYSSYTYSSNTYSKPRTKAYRTRTASTSPSSSQYYIRGPRGGCYYLTGSGRKQYVDRSLCN